MSTTAKFLAVRLTFESSVTFSSGKPDYARGQDHLYSDTIKSAIVSAIVKLRGADGLMAFWNSFRVSSAFPYVGEEYYLPIPLKGFRLSFDEKDDGGMTPEKQAASIKARKKTGRLRYLGKTLFEQGMQGKTIRIAENQIIGEGTMASANTWKEKVEFIRATAQRVNVTSGKDDPESESTYDPEPFFLEQHFPSHDTGWYFLVQLLEPADNVNLNLIDAAMRLLEDEGLGTAKSRGMGHFTYKTQEWTLTLPDAASATHLLNLSLYCPEKEELKPALWDEGAWALLKRGGHIAITDQPNAMRLRKKSIFMLTEGSVFPKALNPKGKYVDLQPDYAVWQPHPILREGRPIFLPFTPSLT